jgi:hypothetical protein
MASHYILADLIKVYKEPKKAQKDFMTVLAWGDEIELVADNENQLKYA